MAGIWSKKKRDTRLVEKEMKGAWLVNNKKRDLLEFFFSRGMVKEERKEGRKEGR
jgi:hypothetical protein